MGLQRPDELMEKLVFAHDAVVPQRWGVYEGILHPISSRKVAP